MFDGMPEQFYQFLAAATTASRTTTPTNNITTLPLSFTLHNNNNNAHHHHHHHHFPTTYSSHSQQQSTFDAPFQHLLHHPHHPHFLPRTGVKDDDDEDDEANLDLSHQNHPTDLQIQSAATALHEGSHHHHHQRSLTMLLPEIPWSNDEMLALFRIRSSMDNTWFPDFIWENVSRKLAELGFKRSAEKCKQKFEEETSSFSSSIISNNCNNKNNSNEHNNNNNNASNTNYRLFGELEELCNNNANITINNGGNNHHQQNEALLPPPPLPLDDRDDHLPQTSLSKDQCLGGGDEDEDDNEDEGDDLGADEEGETGVVGIGDGEEGEDDQARTDENNMNNVAVGEDEQSVGDDSEKTEENTKRVMRKRKRQKKFDMFKGFCEKIVNEMMAAQQQLHCKILQDMIKRDEEKIAKEEAWKRQEIERLEKELEIRAHEQAIAGDRQAKIFDCLKKFNISSSSSNIVLDTQALKETLEKLNKVPNMITSSNSSIFSQDSIMSAQLQPTSSSTTHDDNNHTPLVNHQACPNIPSSSSNENLALLSCVGLENSKLAPPMSSSSMDQPSQNPNKVVSGHHDDLSRARSVVSSSNKFSRCDHTSANATELVKDFKSIEKQNDVAAVVGHGKDDTGRRWPRDEVLALINIRCSLFSNNNNGGGENGHNDKESYSKGPLWERISQKMMELGYKRSAKRCKEKWENINKYFRKTKDTNKKRSIDSRTCPYFHQLSHLYSQGAIVGPTDRPISESPENNKSMGLCGTQQQGGGSSSTPANNGGNNTMHTSQGNDEGVVQVAGFDFEF